jgi:hypothetical protein
MGMAAIVHNEQRGQALVRAHRVRAVRAEVKRCIADGRLSAAEVVLLHRREIEGMAVGDVLTSQRQWGNVRCRKLLRAIGLDERKPIGSMTQRQRLAVAARLSVLNQRPQQR